MTSRTRLWVLAVSTPVIAFALVGGYLGKVMARSDATYQQLRIFQDVLRLVVENYVEEVDVRKAMRGALRGLADGLDADSSFLSPELVKVVESNTPGGAADVGLDLSRQYYLRVVSSRMGSTANKAGIRTGDYIRAIDGRATREMSAFEGMRLLRGAPGSSVKLLVIRGSAADPHEVTLTREAPAGPAVTSRMADASTGYIRVAAFDTQSAGRVQQAIDALAKTGANRYIIDVRNASGDPDDGITAARPFVKTGVLAVKQSKDAKEEVSARSGDGVVAAPAILLVDRGTAGAAETFAAALDGNERAVLIGERTFGRAARQRLAKMPDGSGLLLTSLRYLSPGGAEIHEKGLTPDIEVQGPEVEFGAAAPTADPIFDRALRYFTEAKAAA
jgi:carboxyl-terminal processing protease